MAPSTRSQSANNTPVRISGVVDSELDVLATPTRKTPHCTKCNRPRLGHPRSGCPNSDVTTTPDGNKIDTTIVDALGSMTIDSNSNEQVAPETPARRKGRRSLVPSPPRPPMDFPDTKQAIRERRRSEKAAALAPSQTLPSLSDEDLKMLLGMNDEDDGAEASGGEGEGSKEKVVHWKKAIEMVSVGGTVTRAMMPGTLVTPWSSFASIADDRGKANTQAGDSVSPTHSAAGSVSGNSTETADTIRVEVVSPSSGPRPLARTMSMEERAGFMDHLEQISSTKAYVITKADLAALKNQALPKGLYTRVLAGSSDNSQNIIVVGRDENATEKLYQNLNVDSKQRGLSFKSAAGGAVGGAVAMWTGLAFS